MQRFGAGSDRGARFEEPKFVLQLGVLGVTQLFEIGTSPSSTKRVSCVQRLRL